MALLIYKILQSDDYKNLIWASVLPEQLKKYTYLTSDLEILNYINFGVLILFAKFLSISYLPYGIGKSISECIESMTTKEDVKKEYSELSNDFSKNYNYIRNITSQKLMTGKKLTKEEKEIMKSCKSNNIILEHKQELIEEKNTKFDIVVSYITLPFKFIFMIILVLLAFSYILSKVVILYTIMTNNLCGGTCGFITNRLNNFFSFESIIYYFEHFYQNKLIQNGILLVIVSYSIYIMYVGLKEKGIEILFFKIYSVNDIKSDKGLLFLFSVIFFLLGLAALYDLSFILPDFMKFGDLKRQCDIHNLENDLCGLSLFGLYLLKHNLNFPLVTYGEVGINIIIAILLIGSFFYVPIKSAMEFYGESNKIKKDNYKNYKFINKSDPEEN